MRRRLVESIDARSDATFLPVQGRTIVPRRTCSQGWASEAEAFAGMTSLPNESCRIQQGICIALSPFSPNTTCIQFVTTLDCRQWVRNDPATDPNAVFNCSR